ncbi:ParB/RepB/Spo0J family partition protein [Nocardia pseudovaccinii]|uniref:ParB/RepB/Spo0J family partition protein n=1 Tax=Nocardia pseudovaccinii TaxID=189540 RepID=UPI0007A4581A|nr:ParB/RepB/Spo0J family partition protein [Nocardia pseudovaccinii]
MATAAGLKKLEEARAEAKALTPAEVARLPRMALDRIGPHPLNPEHRHLDKEELLDLISSIEDLGVYEPILLASRAAILSHEPDMAELIPPEHEFVPIDGTRRWSASVHADGVKDIPYVLRDDLAAPALAAKIFLTSSITKLRLTPLEEAQGYKRLQKYTKVNQTAIGAVVGVSQSRVSKALQLLKLPPVVQKAIDAEYISPHAARQLLELPEAEREAVYLKAVSSLKDRDGEEGGPERTAEAVRKAVNHTKAQAEKAAAAASVRAKLTKGGVPEIDPEELFGADDWRHVLRDNEVDQIREAGELAGAVVHDSGRVTYYSTPPAPRHRVSEKQGEDLGTAPGFEEYSNGIDAENGTSGDEAEPLYSNGISEPAPASDGQSSVPSADLAEAEAVEKALLAAKAAHDERVAAMRRIVATPDSSTLVDTLADAILAAPLIDFDDAAEFVTAAGFDVSAASIELLLLAGVRPDIQRAALASALGALEAEAARAHYATNGPWPIPIQRHVRRLEALGLYTLTDYDRARLIETE